MATGGGTIFLCNDRRVVLDAESLSAFETTSKAWEENAAAAVFGKLTLAQYKSKVKPSLEARAVIKDLEEKLAAARVERDNADVVSSTVTLDVVNSIKGDPNFGENSALYAALGYVRKDDRASGLKRNVVPMTPELKAA